MEDVKPTDSPAGIADVDLEELLRLEAEATPGKWVCEYSIDDQRSNSLGEESMIRVDGSDPGSANGLVVGTIYYDGIVLAMTENDGYFIVAMRNAIKPLIQRLKRAEAERDHVKIHEQHMTTNRNYYCERINQIAATLGMAGKDNFSPDAILRKAASVIEERDRLKEALEPFAKLYDEPKHGERDGCPMFIGYEREDCDADFTVGDLRRAAAALADAGKGGGE